MDLRLMAWGAPYSTTFRATCGCLAMLAAPLSCWAQFGARSNELAVNRILMLAPREYQRFLADGEEAIRREEYSEAIQRLSAFLESSDDVPADPNRLSIQEDFFIGKPTDTHFRSSLRSEALRLLNTMPPKGLELFRLNYGAKAQRLLEQAVESRDQQLLAEVSWRYFHTDAGYAACMLLARHYLDVGQPLSAAITLTRMMQVEGARRRYEPELSLLLAISWNKSGKRNEAERVLRDLKTQMPRAEFNVAGARENLFGVQEPPLTWLDRVFASPATNASEVMTQWRMHRGLASRNPTSQADFPLMRIRWHVPIANSPDDDQLIKSIAYDFRDTDVSPIPSISPLVIDDVVLLRTPEQLMAVDFQTGKRIWEYPWSEQPLDLLAPDAQPSQEKQARRKQLEERLWRDMIHGQLASDGRNVYFVDELPLSDSGVDLRFQKLRLPSRFNRFFTNYLVALEIGSQGKYRWRVGGITGEDDPRLANTFFLGPPLVIADQLYVLGEVAGDLSLFVLAADTGKLQWSQQIAHVGATDIRLDPVRRLAGATPSYSDGVLICPTSAGAVVAVDVATRSLLWGHRYGRTAPSANRFRVTTQRGKQRSMDASVTIHAGKVLLTPAESDKINCLDLLTGEAIWSKSRAEDFLYVACVFEDQVVVVNEDAVSALAIDDGKQRWTLALGTEGSDRRTAEQPTGRGLFVEHYYHLPTTQRLIEIDLTTGSISRQLDAATPLGNLVAYRDEIISLSAEGLTTAYQKGPLRTAVAQRLADNPRDAWALEHQGLLAVEDGRLDEALDYLRQAFQAYTADDDNRETTKSVLVNSILTALESDLTKHAELMDEVKPLIDRPAQWDRFLRVRGRYLIERERYAEAFTTFHQLAQQPTPSSAVQDGSQSRMMESHDRRYQVQRHRWIRAGLATSLDRAAPLQRQEMDLEVQRELDRAMVDTRRVGLQRFLDHFADHPLANAARLELARRHLDQGDFLLAEQQALQLLDAPSTSPIAPIAWGLLAEVMLKCDRTDVAAQCLQRIETQWPDTEVWQGMTGRDWVAELTEQNRSLQIAEVTSAWPYGRVRVENLGASSRTLPPSFRTIVNYRPVRASQVVGPINAGLSVTYDLGGSNTITIRDAWGKDRTQLPGTQRRARQFVEGTLDAKMLGHLVLVNFGQGLVAANALDVDIPPDGAVLWPRDYAELLMPDRRRRNVSASNSANRWGQTTTQVTGRRVHTLGPVTADGVVYLQGNSLHCVDPLTGHPFWTRGDIHSEADVWGDDKLVLVAPPEGNQARVFRLVDGDELESRELPPAHLRWTYLGRNILTWDGSKKRTVRLHDPWTGEDRWSHVVSTKAHGEIDKSGLLALVEPDGEFVLKDARTGATLVQQSLPPVDRRLDSVHLFAANDQFLLVRNFQPRAVKGSTIESFPDRNVAPLIDGDVHAFDRATGQSQWQSPAVIEGYGLPLNQPPELPMLAFVRQIGATRRKAKLSLLCLDRRDGRPILHATDLKSTSSFGTFFVSGDPATHQIALRLLHRNNFQITFTDAPQPPAPTAQTGTSSSRRRSGPMNLLGAMVDALEKRISGEAPEQKNPPDPNDRDPFQGPQR